MPLVALIAIFVALAGIVYGYASTKDEMDYVSQQISDDNAALAQNEATIAQIKPLRAEYASLTDRYVKHAHSVSDLEVSFNSALTMVCRRDHVSLTNITFDTPLVGSAAPATGGLNLAGSANGDPQSTRPTITGDLFVRIPAHLTLEGSWRHVASAVQDMTRQRSLVGITQPEIRYRRPGSVELTMTAQILGPHVPILSDVDTAPTPASPVPGATP